MDEGRYGLVRRQEDKHRKFVCIINDILKTRTEVYESCLSREKYETSFRYVKNVMTVRRALVRQKVLQKCLEMRRRGNEGKKGLYGRYDGAPLHTLSRDVEAYIASKHPKVRRLQKVQRLLRDSIENGAILDPDSMDCKVEEFLRKRIVDMDNKAKEKRKSPIEVADDKSIPSRAEGKRKIHKVKPQVIAEIKVRDILKVHEDNVRERPVEKSHEVKDTDDVFVLKRRPTLILPPLATSRALVQGVDN